MIANYIQTNVSMNCLQKVSMSCLQFCRWIVSKNRVDELSCRWIVSIPFSCTSIEGWRLTWEWTIIWEWGRKPKWTKKHIQPPKSPRKSWWQWCFFLIYFAVLSLVLELKHLAIQDWNFGFGFGVSVWVSYPTRIRNQVFFLDSLIPSLAYFPGSPGI